MILDGPQEPQLGLVRTTTEYGYSYGGLAGILQGDYVLELRKGTVSIWTQLAWLSCPAPAVCMYSIVRLYGTCLIITRSLPACLRASMSLTLSTSTQPVTSITRHREPAQPPAWD